MKLLRAKVLRGHVVRFTLDNGKHIDRDFSLVEGGVFAKTWAGKKFQKVRIVGAVACESELGF